MSKKPAFIERLNLMYPGEFEIKRNDGNPPRDRAIIHSKNKRFGSIEIVGDFDEWRDEEDYFIEDENGCYHDAETCGFELHTNVGICIVSPTDIFYMLEKIFSDQMVCYVTIPYWKSRLYKLEDMKIMINKGKLRKKKTYRFWSGNYPVFTDDN